MFHQAMGTRMKWGEDRCPLMAMLGAGMVEGGEGEHAKSWGAYAAFLAGTVSAFAAGLNARCQCRKASSSVSLSM